MASKTIVLTIKPQWNIYVCLYKCIDEYKNIVKWFYLVYCSSAVSKLSCFSETNSFLAKSIWERRFSNSHRKWWCYIALVLCNMTGNQSLECIVIQGTNVTQFMINWVGRNHDVERESEREKPLFFFSWLQRRFFLSL